MKTSQKLALRASEIRQKMGELSNADSLTDEQQTELRSLQTEYSELEPKLRAALVAEDEPAPGSETRSGDQGEDTESVELRTLLSRASIGPIFDATIEKRSIDGAEKELQEHYKLRENQIPLAMLEHRAVTPAPDTTGASQQPIIPGVFPASVGAFLGVDMPTVPTGEAVFPVLVTNATAHVPAEGAPAAETTGEFAAESLSPARLQSSFFFSREDAARFAGMGESLRQNLTDAIADGLDRQIIAGPNGLLTSTNLTAHNANAETDFKKYLTQFGFGRVDGIYASMLEDLRAVMGPATFAHAGSQFQVIGGSIISNTAVDDLDRRLAGLRVSAHVPAAAGNPAKQNAVIRLGMRRDMVAALWEGVTLIPDEVTKAGTGEIVITAVALHAVKILRKAGFYKQQTQHG